MRTVTRTGDFVGRYAVYTDGTYQWYYAGRPGSPEWYVFTDPYGDGEYVDFDPARCAPGWGTRTGGHFNEGS